MLLRFVTVALAIPLLSSACSSLPGFAEQDSAYQSQNAAYGDIVAGETNRPLAFPKLSDAPQTRPERLGYREVMAQYDALMAQHDDLVNSSQADKNAAQELRAQAIMYNDKGERVEIPIEEATARLVAAQEADRAAAQAQTKSPLPKLGGKPPKQQR